MKNLSEKQRLIEYHDRVSNWKHWGPYLSERAWGTVREDYSNNGTAWAYFPHEHARMRAYRWNEDGLAGICDRNQYLCFALALWNHKDPILKERLFGLSGPEGNHGEDVKEIYYYLDSTPTHSYMKMLYKYPQTAFPYTELLQENVRRGKEDPEFELQDTGVFDEDRYFDVTVEYAKARQDDILVRITVANRGPERAPIDLLPTAWFRNTWSWGYPDGPLKDVDGKPEAASAGTDEVPAVRLDHPTLGRYMLYAPGAEELLFTENETNFEEVFGSPSVSQYTKDAFHRYIVNGQSEAVNPGQCGTRAACVFRLDVPPGEARTIRLRLTNRSLSDPLQEFDAVFHDRIQDADVFYASIQPEHLTDEEKSIQRQAFAGMLWSKQLYYLDVYQWLKGDPGQPPPPKGHKTGRNSGWVHLSNFDILSMPDKWEYPWYAAWDLAFHCVTLAHVDPDFAKRQLVLLCREWYMHPNGQFPAYEWSFDDVNPPVHAWAALHVYRIDRKATGVADTYFLKSVFHKLLLNFTWWVNRKDADGNNVFQGGFLGLDNISLFDRSAELPTGGHIDQSDATAWMAFYCLMMLRISLELAKTDPVYEEPASKFYEHFLSIAVAISGDFSNGEGLWDEEDGFFYDVLHLPGGDIIPLRVRSLVGLLPIIAVETLSDELLKRCPKFTRRMNWTAEHRPNLRINMAMYHPEEDEKRHIFAILTPERLKQVLKVALDENEFLSPFGLRSLSRIHAGHPYQLNVNGKIFSVEYEPAEARSGVFGGNSNWRGPVWFPINYLIIEALEKLYSYYGDSFTVEYPTGSKNQVNLQELAHGLSRRLISIFLRQEDGRRPVFSDLARFQDDPQFGDHLLFFEYFHGDTGAGLGASHQTGWTGLVAALLGRPRH